jgi:hypothetical protein
MQFVGWVERTRNPSRFRDGIDGFRFAQPILQRLRHKRDAPPFPPSFRGDATASNPQVRNTENLEIPGLPRTRRPGMTAV